MPEVNLDALSAFFRPKSDHNKETLPPEQGGENSTSIAGDNRGAEGAQTPPGPSTGHSTVGQAFDSIQNAFRDFSGIQQRSPYGGITGDDARVGFILTSDLWIEQDRAIALHAGPAEASWSLALRAQDEEIKSGHARYAAARNSSHGANSTPTNTFFDFAKVEFQFQAGNLMPIGGFENEVTTPYGLSDFYLFLELLNQPPILPTGENEGKHNYTWVYYTSLQFPQMVLRGYFEPEGVSWSDSAENPTLLQWQSSFIAHEMSPNPWEAQEMEQAYQDFMQNNVRLF